MVIHTSVDTKADEYYDALVTATVRRAWARAQDDFESGEWIAPRATGSGGSADGGSPPRATNGPQRRAKSAERRRPMANGVATPATGRFARSECTDGDPHPHRPASNRSAQLRERQRAGAPSQSGYGERETRRAETRRWGGG